MKKPITRKLWLIAAFAGPWLSAIAQPPTYNEFTVKVYGKGQPILFIPGATCSGDEWSGTVARYSVGYQCHIFTLAGYAGTKPLHQQPYLETYKNAIEKYIADQKLNHVILVGHSIGGFLALWIASEMHQRLERVIVVDALPFYAGIFNPAAATGFNEGQAKQLLQTYDNMNTAQMKAQQLAVARSLCSDSTKWDQIASWGLHSDKKTMAYSFCEMLGNNLRKSIQSVNVPVLVLAAYAPSIQYPQYTRAIALAGYQQQYQADKTAQVHISPDSKHFIMYDVPEWFYSQVDAFIKTN